MNELSAIAMLTAFAAGIVSFLSPCVLPLVPGYVSYMAGYSLRDVRNPADVRAKAASRWQPAATIRRGPPPPPSQQASWG